MTIIRNNNIAVFKMSYNETCVRNKNKASVLMLPYINLKFNEEKVEM